MDFNYTSLIYQDDPRMRCALKALTLILLCQIPFAIGLNILPSGFQSIFPSPPDKPENFQPFNIKMLAGQRSLFPAMSLGIGSVSDINVAGVAPPLIYPSPDRGIIQDPTALPAAPFSNFAHKVIMEITPDKPIAKYVIEEQPGPNDLRFTVIKKITLDAGLTEHESDTDSLQQEFQMLLLLPDQPIFFLEAGRQYEPGAMLHTIRNDVLEFIMTHLRHQGAKYLVIYKDDGTCVLKVRYANGNIRVLTQEQLLFKFGAWFNDYIDSLFEAIYSYTVPYRYYSSNTDTVIIAHKQKIRPERRSHKKKEPEKKEPEPVDGQNISTQSSPAGTTTPGNTHLLTPVAPSGWMQPLSAPSPTTYNKVDSRSQKAKDGSGAPVVSQKPKTKPEQRFTIAKATSELAASRGNQSRGISKLAKAIKKSELKKKFKHFDGFPNRESARNQIRWLLSHGHAISLSELILEKANQEWLDSTALNLLDSHLKRTQNTRRTRIATSGSDNKHSGLIEVLDTFIDQSSVSVNNSAKPIDDAALDPLLKSGWRILLANGKKAPLYNSAEQHKLLIDADTPNTSDALTTSTQHALEYLVWDTQEATRISKLITRIVSPDLEAKMKGVLESTPTQPGEIEKKLGIARHIRLAEHPTAGNGRLVLGPSQRHIKVSYFTVSSGEYVDIEISVEFSEIVITNPMQERTSISAPMALRRVYRYPLHSGVATLQPDRIIIATSPKLPPTPTADQIQDWATTLRERQTGLYFKGLAKAEERLKAWDQRESVRPPVDIKKLTEDSRKLKLAQQGFTPNFDYARSWSELPVDDLKRVTLRLAQAMKEYDQLLVWVLENEPLLRSPSQKNKGEQQGWQLVQDYKQYVQDMAAVYRQMVELNKRKGRHELTEQEKEEIEALAKQAESIGGRARNLQTDVLPVRRTQLKNEKKLTDEQYILTEQLRTLYYPYTSAFNIAKASALYQPHQDTDDTDYRRLSLNIQEDEERESLLPALPPPEITLPFDFMVSPEAFEPDIPAGYLTDEHISSSSIDDSDDDSAPEDDED